MFYDTQRSPPTYVVIGVVHGGSICSGFFKNLIFPEIFVRTEDSEVLKFIRNIMESKYQVRRIKRRAGTVKLKPQIVVLILNNDRGNT